MDDNRLRYDKEIKESDPEMAKEITAAFNA
jgi:hypothetical protein